MSEGMMRYFNADKLPIIREPKDEADAEYDGELSKPTIQMEYSTVGRNVENDEASPVTPGSEGSVDDQSTEEQTVEEVEATREQLESDNDDDSLGEEMPLETDSIENEEANDGLDRCYFGIKMCCISLVFWMLSIIFALAAYGLYNNVQVILLNQAHDPVTDNLMLINREAWNSKKILIMDKWAAYQAKRVVVTQTETMKTCESLEDCAELLNAEKEHEDFFDYNFLLALDGRVYETLGWQKPSPLYSDIPTMVVAFIGNYEERAPSRAQLAQFKLLLDISEQLQYLNRSYKIHGRKMDKEPKELYSYVSKMEKWEKEPTPNAKDAYLHPQFDLFPYFEL